MTIPAPIFGRSRVASAILLTLPTVSIGCVGQDVSVFGDDSNGDSESGVSASGDGDSGTSGDAPDSGGESEGDEGTPPPDGTEGILDCPTVELPVYSLAAAPELSVPFQRSCTSCHGGAGQGQGPYPAIPGNLSFDEFRDVVRNGRNLMPQFGDAFIDDTTLREDYDALVVLSTTPPSDLRPGAGEWAWTEEQVQSAYERGMEAWRLPDHHGAACANCHSPDAVDLAVIGYPDAAILRRAGLHIPAEDAAKVVDLVHAQRRRFNLSRACDPSWRPFQPGGVVLADGAPDDERDLAFLDELKRRDLLLATGTIDNLEDAKTAWQQLQAIDLRHLPSGVELPRWTEDHFNGEEHRTPNDYMAPLPSIPNNPGSWYAREDAYINDPTDENLLGLVDGTMSETNDGGYTEMYEESVLNGGCKYSNGDILVKLRSAKRRSHLIASHLFRMELLGRPGFYDLPIAAPFPGRTEALNPFFWIGGEMVEPPCYSDGAGERAIYESMPDEAKEEVIFSGDDTTILDQYFKDITHAWMTVGQMFDQGLLQTEQQADNKLHYWAELNFDPQYIHEPFFAAHRLAIQSLYWETKRGTPEFPSSTGEFGTFQAHPLLDGRLFHVVLLHQLPWEADDPMNVPAVRFKTNVMRMLLFLQRDLLQKGEKVHRRDVQADHCAAIGCQVDKFRDLVPNLERRLEDPVGRTTLQPIVENLDYYTTDITALTQEVLDLVAAAEDAAEGP